MAFGQSTIKKRRSKSTKTKKPKLTLRWWQDEGVKWLVKFRHAGLFLAPGLGKTLITYLAFGALKRAKKKTGVNKLLVVAKLRIVQLTWPAENEKWGLGHKIATLHGPNKDRELERTDADVFLINYDGLPWLRSKLAKNHGTDKRPRWKLTPRGKEWAGDCMIALDESSKIKNTQTKRFKIIRLLAPAFLRRVILTGSPRPRNLEDIFGQVYFLDLGAALGEYITQFRNRWLYPSGYGGYDWKPLPGSEEQIHDRIKPFVLRFGSDVLGMDAPKWVTRKVRLPKEARRVYDELEEEFIAEIEEGEVIASNAGAKSQKLRQLASGGLYVGKGRDRWNKELHQEKTEELIEIAEELQGSPLLVAYEFQIDRDRILRALPKDIRKHTEWIGGDFTGDVKAIERAWNRGDLAMLLGQPASVAHGLNFQESGYTVAFFSQIFNLEEYEQFWQRVWRQGQKNDVTVIDIVAEDTVDEAIIDARYVKDAGQKALLKAMERRYNVKIKGRQKGRNPRR